MKNAEQSRFPCMVTPDIGVKNSLVIAGLLLLGIAAKAQYCIPPPPYVPEVYYITHVVLGDIDQTSMDYNDLGYQDHTAHSTALEQGGAYTITVRGLSNPGQPLEFAVWIDYDQDSTFDNWGVERLGQFPDTVGIPVGGMEYFEVAIPFAVPQIALLGITRLRVRDKMIGGINPNLSPCGGFGYGETEDYNVEIVVASGMHEMSGTNMHVFPNPSQGDITISGADLIGKVEIELADMAGRTVFTEQHTMSAKQPLILPLNGRLAPGSYMLHIFNANGSSSFPVVLVQ